MFYSFQACVKATISSLFFFSFSRYFLSSLDSGHFHRMETLNGIEWRFMDYVFLFVCADSFFPSFPSLRMFISFLDLTASHRHTSTFPF